MPLASWWRNTLRTVDSDRASAWCALTSCRWDSKIWAEVVGENPDLILIPKVEEPEQVREADRMIAEIKVAQWNDPADLDYADSGVGAGDRERICRRDGERKRGGR